MDGDPSQSPIPNTGGKHRWGRVKGWQWSDSSSERATVEGTLVFITVASLRGTLHEWEPRLAKALRCTDHPSAWTFASDSGVEKEPRRGISPVVAKRRRAPASPMRTAVKSFARSSHLFLARLRKGLAPFHPLSKNSARAGAKSVASWDRAASKSSAAPQQCGVRIEGDCGLFRSENPAFTGGRARTSRYVAEYRWVASRPQISSRHALQKQRADGSERRPSRSNSEEQSSGCGRWRGVGGSRGGGQRPAWAPKPRVASWAPFGGFGHREVTGVACLARRELGRSRVSGTRA